MDLLEARAARFDEEDELKKFRSQKVQERNAKLNLINSQSPGDKVNKIIPACFGMCPEFEMIDRQVSNDVSLFEAQDPFASKLIIDPRRAIKKFRRSAAGNYELAEDLRPPQVLLATTFYLMNQVLNDSRWSSSSLNSSNSGISSIAKNVPFHTLYAFIRDRLRAIRTDLTLQNCRNLFSIRIHELTIRFLIASWHLLCEEERAAFEPQQNNEQLNGCLSSLREMYKAIRLGGGTVEREELRYEAEFQAYAILLAVDKKEAALPISTLPYELLTNSEEIDLALTAYSAFQQGNYTKYLNLIIKDGKTSYLQACLMHQFILPLRQRGFNSLISLPIQTPISKETFSRWFNFVDDSELFYYSTRFGFKMNTNNNNNNNNFMVDFSNLIERGEAVDLKAEEENFRVRRFVNEIEGATKRSGRSLSQIIFVGTEAEFEQVFLNSLQKKSENYLMKASEILTTKKKTSYFEQNSDRDKDKEREREQKQKLQQQQVLQQEHRLQLQQQEQERALEKEKEQQQLLISQQQQQQQQQLRLKLEHQNQLTQMRRQVISSTAQNLFSALLDNLVDFNVLEICSNVFKEASLLYKQKRNNLIAGLSEIVLENLLNEHVLPTVLDCELMKMRIRAVDSFHLKSSNVLQAASAISNTFESELLGEIIFESFADFKFLHKLQKKWFNVMRRTKRKSLDSHHSHDINEADSPNPPKTYESKSVHVLFVSNDEKSEILIESLLVPLKKSSPLNVLAHLQSFINKETNLNLISSTFESETTENIHNNSIFAVSHLKLTGNRFNLFEWPMNFPGPTVLVLPSSEICVNSDEFSWNPLQILLCNASFSESESLSRPEPLSSSSVIYYNTYSNGKIVDSVYKFKEILSLIQQGHHLIELPLIASNLKPSQFIPKEFIQSFVIEPFSNHVLSGNISDNMNDLLAQLFTNLIDRIIWILFKGPQVTRILSWHPQTAGRSSVFDSIRRAQAIPSTLSTVILPRCTNLDFDQIMHELDSIYGNSFICPLSVLFSTQSISEIIQTQQHNLFISNKAQFVTDHIVTDSTDDGFERLKVKLKEESMESDAYEEFLKKFL